MKKNRKKYLQRWGYIAFLLVFISIGYKLYELDLHVWSCNEEENTGSCLLASRMYLESFNTGKGEKYLRKSCAGKYALGCYELGSFLIKNGKEEEGIRTHATACELGHKPACKN